MTKQDAIAAHRKMWRWIADETERRKIAVGKAMYFDAMGIPRNERPLVYCYCCQYAGYNKNICCISCPIKWPTGRCNNGGGLYLKWTCVLDHECYNWRKAADIARQIADLPEREDVR